MKFFQPIAVFLSLLTSIDPSGVMAAEESAANQHQKGETVKYQGCQYSLTHSFHWVPNWLCTVNLYVSKPGRFNLGHKKPGRRTGVLFLTDVYGIQLKENREWGCPLHLTFLYWSKTGWSTTSPKKASSLLRQIFFRVTQQGKLPTSTSPSSLPSTPQVSLTQLLQKQSTTYAMSSKWTPSLQQAIATVDVTSFAHWVRTAKLMLASLLIPVS